MSKKVETVEETVVTTTTTTTTSKAAENERCKEHECHCEECKPCLTQAQLRKQNYIYKETVANFQREEKKAKEKHDLDRQSKIRWLHERTNIEYTEITGFEAPIAVRKERVYIVKSKDVISTDEEAYVLSKKPVVEEVEVVEEEGNELQNSLFQQRLESARKGIVTNSILGIVFAILFLLGVAIIMMASLEPAILDPGSATMQHIPLFVCLGAFLLIVVGGMFALFFFGHLVQCIRDSKDPSRKNTEDEKI